MTTSSDLLQSPWYHDFAPLGIPTPQAKGAFQANQQAKQGPLFDLIERALALCSTRSPSCVELFCADGFYGHYAMTRGAASLCGIDLGLPQTAGDPLHLQQARWIGARLGHQDKTTFVQTDVFNVTGEFDLGICAGGLYHIEAPMRLLTKLRAHVRPALVLQTVYSLAISDPDYFETPAPGWTWGCRFSLKWFHAALIASGWRILEASENVLEGNHRLEDRGSAYVLCVGE